MQWIILLCGLLMLFALTRKKPVSRPWSRPATSGEDVLTARLADLASREGEYGYVRVSIHKRLLRQLENSIRYLNRFSEDELLPAARTLCVNARFVQEQTASVICSRRVLSKLPRSQDHIPRICLFAREIVRGSTVLTADSLSSALSAWQEKLPMTADELNALPTILRMVLIEEICNLAQQCCREQRAQRDALQAHLLQKHGKTRAAQKLVQRHSQNPAFWEGLLRMEAPDSWINMDHSNSQDSPEEMVRKQHDLQAENRRWTANAIQSLISASQMPWNRILEEASVIHRELKQDPVYQKMDAESRAYYRSRIARIARRCNRTERAVCAACIALCQSQAEHSLASHTGFYLLDDGYPVLLTNLHAFTTLRRITFFIQNHACTLFWIGSWTAFVALLAIGFFSGYAVAMLIPFAIVLLRPVNQFAHRLIQPLAVSRSVPRMELNHLPPDQKVLVVCQTLLDDAAHALAMVKRLSVMHEANPDANLHFMLLGDFQKSLTATLGSDAEVITAASSATKALCDDTGHPFFYLQRERSYSPGKKSFRCRENRHGALETLLCLIQGRAIRDSFAFASIDPALLRGKYRYVITLDGDTLLPPESALKMTGSMMHPLQKKQIHNGRLHGVSIIQPHMQTAPHMLRTPISRFLDNPYDTFNGIIDPEAYLDAVQGSIPEGRMENPGLLQGSLAGCKADRNIVLYHGHAQTMMDFLLQLHRQTRSTWQLLPCLIPLIGYSCRKELDASARLNLWRRLLQSLLAPLRLLVMLYAAVTGREILLAAMVILPDLARLFPLTLDSIINFLTKIALLPCEACVQTDAVARALYQLMGGSRYPVDHSLSQESSGPQKQPSMLVFGINMTFAGLFAAMPLLLNGAWAGLALAFVWAAFPFVQPVLEQKESASQRPAGYMREVLLRLAQHTLTFFETAITESDHGLPPDNVQIEPNKGIDHRTTPVNIGMYLCSLIAANQMNLLSTDDLCRRMDETLCTMEILPKWHGLPYAWYDTQNLTVLTPEHIASADCGILAVCLLTCAQGMRTLLPELAAEYHTLPSRLDQLCDHMQLGRLYDADSNLFFTGINPSENRSSASHYDLLASESRLLSFVSIMLRRVPLCHWHHLGRQLAPAGTLISQNGTMAEYMVPLLFQIPVPKTLMEHTSRKVLRQQRKHRLGGAFGVSTSSYHAFDPALLYLNKAFGLPELALEAEVESNVLAPYASLLCLPLNLKIAFQNLQRLQRLGLEGPLGLFEAADFSPSRTDGKPMAVVRSHKAHHQGMILCALCNALCEGYIANLFSNLPRAQAYRLLLEEYPDRTRSMIRRPLHRSFKETPEADMLFSRNAVPLSLPVDAHLLSGGGTSIMVDAQGGGYLKHGDLMLTRFHESARLSGGIRIYLRDSESGAYWIVTDPYLTRNVQFDAAQVVFRAERFDILSELRIWIDPLDGSCVHCLTLENSTESERVMEVCSFLEPALCEPFGSKPTSRQLFKTERLSRHGVYAARDEQDEGLWHLLSTETPFSMFRIQTDRSAFLGRGRSFLAPRALEFPVSAVADSLGDMIDPCLSLRGQFSLPPKGTAVFCFATKMARAQDSDSAFKERRTQRDDILHTFDSALTRSTVTARYLRMTDGMQTDVSRLLGPLVYQGQPMSESSPADQAFRYSSDKSTIGSDGVPVLLYTCCGSMNEPLLKLLVNAHAFYRINGFVLDLVILIEKCAKQAELLADAQSIVDASHSREIQSQKGGIHLLSRLSAENEQMLRNLARLILSSGGGTLEQQLSHGVSSVRARPLYMYRSAPQWKQQIFPTDDLLFFNSYGGFTSESGDYRITLSPGRMTPAPWRNPLYNTRFGTMAAESGLLFSCLNDETPITPMAFDSVSPHGEENFFLRDAENRLVWSLTRLPLGHNTTVRVTHAPGETTYESSGYGMTARLTCFTDTEETAGLRVIHLQNDSQTERTITLFHTCRFTAKNRQHLSFECTSDRAWCFLPHANGWVGLCALDPRNASVSSMPDKLFQGLWSPVPFALSSLDQLPHMAGDTAILSFPLRLKPNESYTLTNALVFGTTQERFESAVSSLRSVGATSRFHELRREWQERLDTLQFDLPDHALNLLLGRWLPYQVQARFTPGSGFYLPITRPDEARAYILTCAAQADSGVQKLFLPMLVSAYIDSTQDQSILEEELPSQSTSTLRAYCLHVLNSMIYGAHDLPLMDSGIESVWAGMLLCEAIRRFAPYCSSDVQQALNERREALFAAFERSAWDGAWYLYGWDREGRRLGSRENEAYQIALLPQCWAVICGASRERCETAMEHVWRLLYEKDAGLIKATAGTVENRSQDTIAACWAMAALHQLGQDERAWELLGALMPTNHTVTRQLAARYRMEPYVMPSDVYAIPSQRGRGGSTWDSSVAGCFLTIVVQQLLGLRIRGSELRLRPVVPSSWESLRITYRHGSATYHLHAERSCLQPILDGAPLLDGFLTLVDDGKIHEAVFPLRS